MTGTLDKLKNILSPGHKQDDETLYGAGQDTHSPSSHKTSTAEGTSTSHSGHHSGVTSDSSKHDSSLTGTHDQGATSNVAGVGRQVFNPHGEKYSETSYGPAGSHTATEQLPPSVGADQHLYTDPAAQKKEHGVLRQILNPGGAKYDETRFGTTASTEPPTSARQDGHSNLPATTAGGVAAGSTTAAGSDLSHHQHNQYGSSASHTHAASGAAAGTTRRPDEHHLGRDATLAGGVASGAAIASHEARDHHHDAEAGSGLSHHVHNGVYTKDGAHSTAPTAGTVGHSGAGTTGTAAGADLPAVPNTGGRFLGDQSGTYPNTSSNTNERSFPLSGGATSTLPDRSVGQNTAGGNHGREGLAAAAGAATLASAGTTSTANPHEHQGFGHKYHGANIDPASPTGGPHATIAANRLDPNLDSSGSTTATDSQHHYGRDTALAGGAGAAAAGGAYAAGKHTGDQTGPAPRTLGPHDKDWKNVVDPRVQPEPSQMKSSGPDSTGPASATVGPHDKNWKNILDPRVKPGDSNVSHGTDTKPTTEESRNYGLGTGANIAAAPHSAQHDTTATHGSSEHHHNNAPVVAGGVGAGAAGVAAGHAWKEHEQHKHHPVQGEKGLPNSESNPYSSHGIDPRVDGRHATTTTTTTTTTSGHAGSSRTPGSDPSGHHFGRDAAIAGASVGAGGLGAHELGSHHGTQVGNEGLGAHDPATHHSATGSSNTTGATQAARHAYGDSLSNDGSSTTYRGEHHADEKLQHARHDEASRAHDQHEESGKKKSGGLLGFLHRDKKDKHEHDENTTEPHLHHDDRNRLHKDPPKGHAAGEGTTIGTGSGITAETIGSTSNEGATKTGKEMGSGPGPYDFTLGEVKDKH